MTDSCELASQKKRYLGRGVPSGTGRTRCNRLSLKDLSLLPAPVAFIANAGAGSGLTPAKAGAALDTPRFWRCALARRQNHHHLPSFHLRILFQFREDFGVFLHPIEQIHAQMLVRHFTAAEAQGDL